MIPLLRREQIGKVILRNFLGLTSSSATSLLQEKILIEALKFQDSAGTQT